jgi:hypothetical protein
MIDPTYIFCHATHKDILLVTKKRENINRWSSGWCHTDTDCLHVERNRAMTFSGVFLYRYKLFVLVLYYF